LRFPIRPYFPLFPAEVRHEATGVLVWVLVSVFASTRPATRRLRLTPQRLGLHRGRETSSQRQDREMRELAAQMTALVLRRCASDGRLGTRCDQ
jgi:hypothetical protein